jgi:hypothetical protein
MITMTFHQKNMLEVPKYTNMRNKIIATLIVSATLLVWIILSCLNIGFIETCYMKIFGKFLSYSIYEFLELVFCVMLIFAVRKFLNANGNKYFFILFAEIIILSLIYVQLKIYNCSH